MRIGYRTPTVRPLAITVTLAAMSVVAACGGPHTHESPAQLLNEAKTQLDSTTGVHVVATSADIPANAEALISADGIVTHQPGFIGHVQVAASGLNLNAKVTAVGGTLYAKPGFLPGYMKIDPAKYGIPDPATLIDRQRGITSLMPATQNPTLGKEVRQSKTIVAPINGSLLGPAVAKVFPTAGPQDVFSVQYRIAEDSHQLTGVTITGPFYGAGTHTTYTITVDQYGSNPQITPPS